MSSELQDEAGEHIPDNNYGIRRECCRHELMLYRLGGGLGANMSNEKKANELTYVLHTNRSMFFEALLIHTCSDQPLGTLLVPLISKQVCLCF